MKFKFLKRDNKSKKRSDNFIFFEDALGFKKIKTIYPTIKGFLNNAVYSVGKIKNESNLGIALLFALIMSLLVILTAHIFSTYVYKDSTFFLADFNEFIGKISPVFPLFKGWFVFTAPFIAAFIFFGKVLLHHAALLPQKPKRGFKTTLKLAAYAESADIFFAFLFIYLIIARIPESADDYFKGAAEWMFVILFLLYLITNIKIMIEGFKKFHGLTEPEAIFAAFFPFVVSIIIPVFLILLL